MRTWQSSPVGLYLLALLRSEIILSLLIARLRLPHSLRPMSKPRCCRDRYSSTHFCTMVRSWDGRNMPSIPDPYLDVPSAMLPLSMTTTSFHPLSTRW